MINEHTLANLGMSPEGYNNLTDSEKATVDQVLQEMAKGNFDVFDELYYTDYDEFKDNFYWSSNPGAEGFEQGGILVGNRGEDVDYARATKVVSNDGTRFSHVESAANQKYPNYTENGETKEGGSALRTMKFRIRAAYIPEEVKPKVEH